MILAIFSTILGSLSSILRKKTLDLTELKGLKFLFFGYIGSLIISIYFIISGKTEFDIMFNIYNIIIIISIVLIDMFSGKLEQTVYKNEKYSVLLPFENLERIFIVIAGFFLFGDSSIFNLVITLLTIFVIILFSIDYKEFKLPKYMFNVVLVNLARASVVILTTILLKKVSLETFFSINQLSQIIMVLIILIIIYKKGVISMFNQTRGFYKYRISQNFLRAINYMFTLYLIQEMGVVMTILLSFLGTISMLIFGYFVLKEIPGKKDVILAFIVSVLIGIGYYFG